MRGLLAGAPGVQDQNVAISKDPKDRMNNSVTVTYDPKKTTRAAIIKQITDVWDIEWWECPCSLTSARPKDC